MPLIIDAVKEFGEDISQKEGHLFFLRSAESVKDLIDKISTFEYLTENQTQLLKAIYNTNSTYVTVRQIEDYLGKSRDSINKLISKLADLTVINSIDFKFSSGKLLPKTKCFTFPEKDKFITLLSLLEDEKKTKQNNKIKTTLITAKNNALAEHDLPLSVLENKINQGFFPSKLPPFERMLPDRSHKDNNYISSIYIKQKKVIVEAKSAKQIMNGDDLKTLYTLMTLSINQQANLLDYYIQKGCSPLNHHYIEIRHIMKVLGKSSAGSYYEAFVKSILRIKDTSFDLHQLEAMYENAQGESIFVSQDFRFFDSCQAISKEGPIIASDKDNKKSVKIKPFAFLISWHPTLFNKMLTDKYFFVIPLKILAAPTLIFLFYMILRNHFSFDRTKTWVLTVEELHDKLNSSALLHNFKRDFIGGLNTWNEGKDKLPSNGELLIDIQGFMITVQMVKDAIVQLHCKLDTKKMLSYAGLESDDDGLTAQGTLAAPTISNPIGDLLPILQFKDGRGSEFPQESNMRLLLNSDQLLKDIKITKQGRTAIIIAKQQLTKRLTAYTDDSEILFICEEVQENQKDQAAFFTHLQTLRSKLSFLTAGHAAAKKEISPILFSNILKGLVSQHKMILEIDELFDLLNGKGQLIKIAAEWDGDIQSPVLQKISALYQSSVLA